MAAQNRPTHTPPGRWPSTPGCPPPPGRINAVHTSLAVLRLTSDSAGVVNQPLSITTVGQTQFPLQAVRAWGWMPCFSALRHDIVRLPPPFPGRISEPSGAGTAIPVGSPGGGAQAPRRCCHTANLGCSACLHPRLRAPPMPRFPTCAGERPQRRPPWVPTIKGLVFECLKAGPGDWQSTSAPGSHPQLPSSWALAGSGCRRGRSEPTSSAARGHTDPRHGRRPCQRPPARVTALPARRAGLCPHLQSQPLPKERYQPRPTRWMLRPERLPKAPWRPPSAPTSPSC